MMDDRRRVTAMDDEVAWRGRPGNGPKALRNAEIRAAYAAGDGGTQSLAHRYGISRTQIRRILELGRFDFSRADTRNPTDDRVGRP